MTFTQHWVLLCASDSRTEVFKYPKITFETDLRHSPVERELVESCLHYCGNQKLVLPAPVQVDFVTISDLI